MPRRRAVGTYWETWSRLGDGSGCVGYLTGTRAGMIVRPRRLPFASRSWMIFCMVVFAPVAWFTAGPGPGEVVHEGPDQAAGPWHDDQLGAVLFHRLHHRPRDRLRRGKKTRGLHA